MRQFDVDKMQPGEEPAVIAALARAFYDDPLFGRVATSDVLDGPQSRIWAQATNRMHAARGLLAFLAERSGPR